MNLWLADRWLSLSDGLAAIEDNARLQDVAKCLGEFLEAQDFEAEVSVAAYEQLLDAVDAAIEQEIENDLLVQLHDDLTYFPDEIVRQVKALRPQ